MKAVWREVWRGRLGIWVYSWSDEATETSKLQMI